MLCRLCQGCVAVVSGSRARIIIIISKVVCLFLREARLTHLTHGNIYRVRLRPPARHACADVYVKSRGRFVSGNGIRRARAATLR